MTDRTWQDRAHGELDNAQLLLKHGGEEAAISRACYAAFYAAKDALDLLGREQSTHSGVISAFGRFVVVEGGGDRAAGRALNALFDSRNRADYIVMPMSADAAREAIEAAKVVVDAVDAWLAEHK
jgi:uncharacterized protein (UPF0332 family)